MTDSNGTDAEVEARLDQLQRDSEARRGELKAIGAQLPEAISRRVLVRSMFRSVAEAPDKLTVVKRTGLKILRTPADLVRRLRKR